MTLGKRHFVISLGAVCAFASAVPIVAKDVPAAGTPVTQATYSRAESDRSFFNIATQAGGINKFFKIRKPTPIDSQTVVRMNKDTLYAGSIVDTAKGATITIPEMPKGRYFSVLLIDNDHYPLGTIYTPGVHNLPAATKYIAVVVRIQLLRPDDPADVALVNKLQDAFVITAGSADPFPKPKWDPKSLTALTAEYNKEFGTYSQYPDGFMAPRGKADEAKRHLAVAGAWGLFPNKDAIYINYNPKLPATGCYTATYTPPENKAFWSITMYGGDGYMKNANSILNASNRKAGADGRVKVYFGSAAACGGVPNRIDISDGWNFLMRVYRPGKTVLDGSYKLPAVAPVKGS
jgi:hypothetical protein